MTLWRVALAAALAFWATPAEAHAFGARYDLPLPLALYLGAAGAAVLASFLAALAFLRSERTRSFGIEFEVPLWAAQAASAVLGVLGILLLALVLGAAFFGPQEAVRNFATVFVWVIWWVGFLLLSALVLNLWPPIDPFRRLGYAAAKIVGRRWPRNISEVPAAFGLLAPIGLLTIAWVELVSDWSEEPFSLGVLIAAYLAAALAGGLAYGRQWFERADPLSRVFGVLGRMAPIAAAGTSTLRLRPPGEGILDRKEVPAGEVALVTALIGIVLFDGLAETPAWAAVLDFISQSTALRPSLLWLRDQDVDLIKVIRTLGLLTVVGVFYGAFWLLIAAMRAVAVAAASHRELAQAFVGTLLPIAVAYHLSHYASYLLVAGQLVFPTASDPFGLGWDVFGTRTRSIDVTLIGTRQIWWIAFSALIAGHSLSVLVAHRRALQVFGSARQAVRSQIPMTFAMVGLTVLSLWILSQPITE